MSVRGNESGSSEADRTGRRGAIDSTVAASIAATSGMAELTEDERTQGTACVLVVDDHALLSDMIVATLGLEGFAAGALPPSSRDAVLRESARRRPTLALVDLDLGTNAFSGFDLIEPLVASGCDVITLTEQRCPLLAAHSIEQGAIGTICKDEPRQALVDDITLAARGEHRMPYGERDALRRSRAAHLESMASFERLTPREREILQSLMDGCKAETTAASSFVSLATVRSQIRNLFMKLEVCSQLEAVAKAVQAGWSLDAVPLRRYSPTLAI